MKHEKGNMLDIGELLKQILDVSKSQKTSLRRKVFDEVRNIIKTSNEWLTLGDITREVLENLNLFDYRKVYNYTRTYVMKKLEDSSNIGLCLIKKYRDEKGKFKMKVWIRSIDSIMEQLKVKNVRELVEYIKHWNMELRKSNMEVRII